MKSPTYLIPGLRTPFCKVDGPLKSLDAIQMSVPVAQAMAKQADRADLMIWGTVIPSLRWSNLAREVLLDAKLDATTPAFSTVQACSTSMVGVFEAAGMLNDHVQLAMVGGVEAMSRVQIGLTQGMSDWLRSVMQARTFGRRLDALTGITLGLDIPSVKNRVTGKSMGEHCEEMAKSWKILRAEQDRIAYESHKRAVAAMAAGFFDDLVITVNNTAKDGIPRADSSLEKLATLKPAFARTGDGTITAGNASPLTDGAAAIWVANEVGMKRITGNANIRNAVKLIDYEIAGVDIFKEGLLMAPAYAIPRLLARNNLRLDGIDLWEIHEAFAAQVLCNVAALESDAFLREKAGVNVELGKFPWDRLNPNGGSVAIGHPFGATGARILSQAAKELAAMGPGKRAIVSICADGGLGTVALLES
jgi:acetyl-CoA C-acetyltransferase